MKEKEPEQPKGAGREPQPQEEKLQERRDISHLDQQEGNMNNGELGGNFKKEDNLQHGKR